MYIEELEAEILTLKEGLEKIEDAGMHCETAHIVSAIKVEIESLEAKLEVEREEKRIKESEIDPREFAWDDY